MGAFVSMGVGASVGVEMHLMKQKTGIRCFRIGVCGLASFSKLENSVVE